MREKLFTASLPESTGGPPPAEFQIFPYGAVGIDGEEPFTVDEAAVAEVIRRFRERGLDMVVDYEHQTEMDTQAPAAGWIKELIDKGREGLWAVVEWTERAAGYLRNREYRYYSPVFLISSQPRRLVELLRVALTNAPRLNGISPIVAKDGQEEELNMEWWKRYAGKLGLTETATEAEVTAALQAKLDRPVEQIVAKEITDALGLEQGAGRSEVVATIHALKQRPDLVREVAALKEKLALRDRDELVAAALKDGKITPAQKEWAETYALNDSEGFKLFVAKAPQVVPVDNLPALAPVGSSESGMDDAVLQVAKMFGNSAEDVRKYGLGE